MKIFVFDTETTGFIDKKEQNLDLQPHIIQFAGILGELGDGTFKEEKRINIMINPGQPIPYEASAVNHIYDIDVKNAPMIHEKIEEIIEYINTPHIIIGHNIEYDESMIKLELKRLEKEYLYKPKQVFCTMNSTIDFCKLPRKNANENGAFTGYKRPKLGELHKKLFNEYFIGAHDAMTDVEATLRCVIELDKNGLLPFQETKHEVLTLF